MKNNKSIISILVFCVCVSVISDISGTGGRSSMLLTSTWRASLGELQRLLFESTRCTVGEEKPLEVFRW